MHTSEILFQIRNNNHLTQNQMAKKLFVTRQAVSRWETGETMPNIETFTLITKEFGVSFDYLLGTDRNKVCQSCTYPLRNPEELGTNKDGTWNTDYCIYCYKNGEWVDPNMTIQGIIDYTIPYMTSPSLTAADARKKLEEWVPTLKRWKIDNEKR